MSEPPRTPKELDAIVDKVLAYRPKPKKTPAKKHKKASVRETPKKKTSQ